MEFKLLRKERSHIQYILHLFEIIYSLKELKSFKSRLNYCANIYHSYKTASQKRI